VKTRSVVVVVVRKKKGSVLERSSDGFDVKVAHINEILAHIEVFQVASIAELEPRCGLEEADEEDGDDPASHTFSVILTPGRSTLGAFV